VQVEAAPQVMIDPYEERRKTQMIEDAETKMAGQPDEGRFKSFPKPIIKGKLPLLMTLSDARRKIRRARPLNNSL